MIDYPVSIMALGSFAPKDIVVTHVDIPPLPRDVLDSVESIWADEVARNPNATPGELLVAVRLEEVNGKIGLRCGKSTYKNFMGTTASDVVPDRYRHRAIGMLAVTTTADGYVMLGVRSPAIDWPLLRHVVPAGRLRPIEQDPLTGILAEFNEELGLGPKELLRVECIGVVGDQTWGRLNVEFVFRADTQLSAREVLERARTARSVSEHCQLEPFPWRPDFIRDLLLVDPDAYVPTGWAGLALALQRDFGHAAFPTWRPIYRSYAKHVEHRARMIRVK